MAVTFSEEALTAETSIVCRPLAPEASPADFKIIDSVSESPPSNLNVSFAPELQILLYSHR